MCVVYGAEFCGRFAPLLQSANVNQCNGGPLFRVLSSPGEGPREGEREGEGEEEEPILLGPTRPLSAGPHYTTFAGPMRNR